MNRTRLWCGVVVGVIAVGCASGPVHGSASPRLSVVASGSPVVASPRGAGADTALALASDHWSTLPATPIPTRSGATGGWTGRQFLVWGGAAGKDGDDLRADGAAYEPATHKWTTLPAAPLTARTGMTSVWTGSELFVWGGDDKASEPGHAVNDGALFDPIARKWTKLPPSPLAAREYAAALLLAGKVVVIGGQPVPVTVTDGTYTDLASYDPKTNVWARLAPMPAAKGHVLGVVAVPAGDRLYAWQLWEHTVPDPVASGDTADTSSTSGIDLSIFDVTTNTWSSDPSASRPTDGTDANDAPTGIEHAFFTGSDIVVPATQPFCGGCSGPWASNQQGRLLNIATNTWTSLPRGPTDDLEPNVAYTGDTMLAFDTDTSITGPDGNHLPGEAAAWDPTFDRWTSLPAAPLFSGENAVAVWAGDRLLEWGPFYSPTATGNGGAASSTSGLSFGP